MHQLSKKDKAGLRQLIEKGVQTEYTKALNQINEIIQKWQKGLMDNREAYQYMYQKLEKNDRLIARRYDGMTGSRYVFTVIDIFCEGQISRDDLSILSEDLQQQILQVADIRGKRFI